MCQREQDNDLAAAKFYSSLRFLFLSTVQLSKCYPIFLVTNICSSLTDKAMLNQLPKEEEASIPPHYITDPFSSPLIEWPLTFLLWQPT
jgi:hypothetical protein